ncbi:bifunctional 23S rRNA (guanine(2069)-N(7))-methyltransferase RlmK/23S rRNA (guanine(2445)-N(2))-methyltransferase RlmL [Pontibacterium granulatum]|uniref:bifunctional 23S rRNA (guanine(2069)-N(7))-methyltransferase RlmK/23S rRNA (guanine(2445)-N(2))-methyltransferase RlmL n=1 Tax=Pontibacterium granulatum TaxID=2036029 RepID=UPI00249C1C8F|nr:bifunctional 23S rRNA (guanine(2069)-N(7))-methyltransferase RlmK/23S rRNA (guanine(2445)-N(2))-methyltransferase RlmL [Pontibacterium granulatum]MDI3323491.1 bifunctional 23S rRNA (guanine(2069)-N(7))-methyltransferase RlmK/23S rRNA (guanine(2445)-N(2))-methyltransferase RlmL [Pontibacterium granulatum]
MNFFLTCPKGVELLLEEELHGLGIQETRQTVAGVYFQGELEDAYRVCLWSRLANRVLMNLHQFEAESADQLYAGVQQINWLEHMRPEGSLAIDFTGRTEGINNTRFGAQKTKDAIVDQIRAQTGRRPAVERQTPDIRINVHLQRGVATLSLDLSGDSLHRRAYRLRSGEAPLKENLASALLIRCGWPNAAESTPVLVDPMCGSGTLLIEAVLMAADIAPGLQRRYYGFNRWLQHKRDIWQALKAEAEGRRDAGLATLSVKFSGRDMDSKVLRTAKENAARAGVDAFIEFRNGRVEDLQRSDLPEAETGLMLTNPPYGERLGEESQLMFLYRHLGDLLKRQFPGWQAAIFTGNPELCKVMGLRADKQYKFFNGPIESRLFIYSIAEQAEQGAEQPSESGEVELSEGAQMFANRLRKNLKQMAKWVKRENIQAYRAYDADIPEYQVAVDIYGDQVHLQEYAPPKSVDKVKSFSRLNEVMTALPVVLDMPAERITLKQRKRQQGTSQYEKQSQTHHFFEVNEHGVRLLVNLKDYLDTGLFLDHRPVRHLIQQEAKGKDVLNLFCYTGTASAHAAVGGAKSTTSVDMSSTYLNWAERNLELNGCKGKAHRFIRSDCFKWLHSQFKPEYDLIFMDPPTFSNSKRMSNILDVQRDHVELVEAAMGLLRPGGKLIFSNNYRRFKLDYDALAAFEIRDITTQTLDPDFKRNQRIHVCFEITHKA